MDTAHLRGHLNDLSRTLEWLRTLTPDSPRYKVWLGDVIEFARVAYGAQSAQLAAVRAVLTSRARLAVDAGPEERTRDYLDRLDAFAAVLTDFRRALPEPLNLIGLDLPQVAQERNGREIP